MSTIIFLLYYFKECNLFSMSEKKVFSTRINDNLIKALKHLSVDKDSSLSDLLEEAIEDLLKKYDKKETKTKK